MAATLKLRRGTSTPSLVQSELFFNTTSNTLIVGDGSTNHTLVKIGSNTGNINLTGDISASNLTLSGNATVNGNITFGGSLITLGDSDTDNIVFTGELSSSLIPNDDNAFDIGTSTKKYKHLYAVSASISDINGVTIDSFITGTNSFTASQQNINSLYNSFTQSADSRLVDLEFFSSSEYQTDSSSFDIRVNTLETTFSSSVDSRLDLLENFSSSEYITDSSSFDTRLDTLEGSFSTSVDLRLDNTELTGSNHESRINVIETTFSSSVDSRLDLLENFSSSEYITDSSSFDLRVDNLEASQSYFDGTFSSSVDLRLDNTELTGSDHESRITSIEGYSASLDSRLDDLEATGSNHETRLDTIEGSFSSSVDSRLNNLNSYTQSTDLRLDDLEATGSNHESRIDVIETTFSSSVDTRLDNAEWTGSNQESRLDTLETTFSSSVDTRLDYLEGSFSTSVDSQLDAIHTYTSSLKNSIDVSGQNLTVYGNLTVQGTQTSLNTNDLIVEDKLIAVASGSTTSAQADGAGIFISGANASILWDDLTSQIVFNNQISSSVGFKGDGSNITNIQHGNVVFGGSNIVSGSDQVSGSIYGDVSGDITISNLGVASISSNVIVNNDIKSDAGIVYTKLNLNGSSIVSGSDQVTESLDLLYEEIASSTHTLFSSSVQVNADTITNFDTNVKDKLNVEGVHSGSFLGTATTTQLDEGSNLYYTDARVKTKLNTENVVSSSAQISAYNTFLEISGDSVVSGSSQITFNDISQNPLTSGSSSITASGHFVPSQTELYDLGSSTNRWRDLYLSGSTINLGGTLISKNVSGDIEFINADTLESQTAVVSFNSLTNKPTLVSGSSQISFSGISNKPTLVSGSSQIDVNDTQNFTSFSSSVDSRLDSVETDQHTHTNKGNLDTIDQNLSSSDTPTFVNLSLTSLGSLGSGEVNAVFSGSAGTLGTRALGTSAFFNVSASVGDDPNSVPTNQAVNNALIAAGAGDLTEFNPTNTFNPNTTGLVHLSSGTEIGGVRGVQGNIHVAIDTGSTHFIDGVNGIVSIGDGVISSSAQISSYGVFAELNGDNLVSSSAQISSYGVFAELNGDNLVSSSAQIISLLPSGILSSSVQDFDTFSGSVDSRLDTLEGETHENPLTFNDTTTIDLVRTGDIITANVIGGIVSSSAQISGYNTFLEINGDNVVSSSTQISNYGIFAELNGDGLVSSSAQISGYNTFLEINGDSVVSSSAQISGYNTFLEINGDSVVSGSSQIDLTGTTNYASGIKTRLNTEGVISGSTQIEFNNINNNPIESGSTSIIASNHFVPSQTELYDLGSSTKRWRDLYLSGSTIDLGGTLIQRDSGTGNVSFLDSNTLSAVSAQVDFTTIVNKPTLISGSSQVNADTITNFDTNVKDKLNVEGIISGSDQLTGSLVDKSSVQTITGTKTFNDIVVNGTGSFAYIQSTAGSAKIIGDSFIILNNDTPTQRYAGISVQDSGSANTTASLQFDGQTNDWFYQYSTDGGVTTNHGVVLFGPEYSGIGNPTYLTNNKIPKSDGSHHLNDSNITDSGTLITLGSNVQVNGNIALNGTVDGVDVAQLNTDFNTLKGKTLVSGSSQVNHDSTTGFVANEHIDHSTVTMTAGNGLTGGGTITETRTFNVGQGDGISVTADAIAVDGTVLRTTGDGVISGSAQVTLGGDLSGTANNATVTKVQNVALTSGEATQLANIDTTTISSTQWGYVGALNQGLTQTSTVQFGKVGVGGASDATYELKVTGDIGATGDVVAYISSDRRLKDEITPIPNSLEKINQIGGYSFVWNDNQDIYKGKDYGVIAQEIEEILPELVETRESGYKAVKYDRIVSLLIEGIKELSNEVKDLKSRLG